MCEAASTQGSTVPRAGAAVMATEWAGRCRRSASRQRSRGGVLWVKPAACAKDLPRELDLTRLEGPLLLVPLVDGADGFVDCTSAVVNRHPVHRGEQLHAERGLEALYERGDAVE